MLFYVYILQSQSHQKYYVGQTNNLPLRIARHNAGLVKSTKSGLPWILIQSFETADRSSAMALESKIKKRGIKRYLQDTNRLI
ncbi:MAG: GIY-YIG nuclease family protein [Niabella sp.]|nr:GIY-YIG nuclease family protein [Niabella sp.]